MTENLSNKERLTFEEVAEILLKKDIYSIKCYVKKGLIPEIAVDEKSMTIDAEILARSIGVLNFDEPFINEKRAREILNIQKPKSILYFCKKKNINVYRITEAKGVAILFRESDLQKHAKINIELLPHGVEDIARKNVTTLLGAIFPTLNIFINNNERDAEIFQKYFEGASLAELGETYSLSTERIRMIIEDTKKKSRHSIIRLKRFISIFGDTEYKRMTPDAILRLLKEEKRLREENAVLLKHLELNSGNTLKTEIQLEEILKREKTLQKKLSEFDLSTRTLNILRSKSIETLSDLEKYSEADILGIRNAGKKVVKEIHNLITELGLNFKKW